MRVLMSWLIVAPFLLPHAAADVDEYIRLTLLAQRMQKRLVAILEYLVMHFPRTVNRPRAVGRPRVPLVGHALVSQHVAVVVGSRWRCVARGDSPGALSAHAALDWFATPCRSDKRDAVLRVDSLVFSARARPVTIPTCCPVVLKGVPVHASHRLFVYRGIFCCSRCGHLAAHHLRLLRAPCPGVPLASGRRNIAQLRGGSLPWGVKSWPSLSRSVVAVDV